MKRSWIFVISLSAASLISTAKSQDDTKSQLNPVITGVPSLTIAPNARGGGMGDAGVASSPDINSQYWNPSKYVFMKSGAGVSLSYTPWLRKLVNDIDLAYVAGYLKFGEGDLQAVSGSLRYFSLGKIQQTDQGGNPITESSPYELAFDLGYSRKLSEKFSAAVVLRGIYSDLQVTDQSAAWAFAADIAGYYTLPITFGNGQEGNWSFGLNASNIGSKISYVGETSNFLPTNLRLGTGIRYPFDTYNSISLNFDANKFMIPTRPIQKNNESLDDYNQRLNDFNNMSPIKGIFTSFNDAPNGFKEELQEINLSFGAEYNYNNQFFARGGYFYEHPNKGNRTYYSIGAGFKMNVFHLDVSYLISAAQSNPLDQTLRFSLSFDLDGLKSLTTH